MPYAPIPEIFGEADWYEPSIVGISSNSPILPADEYALVEAYCTDENCDCRRVFLNIVARKRQEVVAVVAYGWESEFYYRKWFGGKDNDIDRYAIKEMMGPVLNLASPQSELAPALLELVRDLIRRDPTFIVRLKRHYRIFKENVDPKHFRKPDTATRVEVAKSKSKKRKRH